MDPALFEALHQNKLLAAQRVAQINPGSASERLGGCFLVDTGEPTFGAANSATPLTPAAGADVPSVIRWFQGRGAPFHFVVRPDVDRSLYKELQERGFRRVPS